MGALWTSIKGWSTQPFTSKMDLLHWMLFVGLLIVAVILWTRILSHLDIEKV